MGVVLMLTKGYTNHLFLNLKRHEYIDKHRIVQREFKGKELLIQPIHTLQLPLTQRHYWQHDINTRVLRRSTAHSRLNC